MANTGLGRWREQCRRRPPLAGPRLLLNPGQPVVEPFAKSGRQDLLGRNYIDPLEPGKPRQQIEVRGPQAPRVGVPVGHGDDDMAEDTVN